jgi:hypothetical protein
LGKIKFLNDTLLGYQLDQFKFNNLANSQNYFAVQYKATKFLVPILNVYSGSGGSGVELEVPIRPDLVILLFQLLQRVVEIGQAQVR